jgi:hypothetical protein
VVLSEKQMTQKHGVNTENSRENACSHNEMETSPARIPIFCFAKRINLVSRLPGDKSLSTVYVLEDLYHHRSFRGNQEGYSCLGLRGLSRAWH